MEKGSIFHLSDSIYSFPLSINEIEIRFKVKKDDDITKVELVYNDKYKFHEFVKYKELQKSFSDEVFDYYVERIKLTDTRFAYVFRLTLKDGQTYYYSEEGISKDYDITKGFYSFFQVSTINEVDIVKVNKKIENRVFYQIFVDRFNKDREASNPRINIKWGEKVNSKTIAGGNLKGIINKIDYLKNLGVDALYLTPIFKSPSNHKYDTVDYFKVSKDFGANEDLRTLIEEVHKNNMIILLDGVFNHISNLSFFFKDVVKKGKASNYFDWFYIDGDKPSKNPLNYKTFAYCFDLPKLNLNNPEVQKYILKVGRHYAKDYKIDGFRLDVSDEIPHYFWIEFKKEMLKINEDFVLIGENWHNAGSYLNCGFEFDSIMNYSFLKATLDFVAFKKINATEYKNRLVSLLMRYKTNVNFNLLNLLSSHDVDRFLSQCNENEDKFLIGYAILFMYIGVPCVYYGDEIGIDGGYDPLNRACFIWDESNWNFKIFSVIKKLIEIRKKEKINELEIDIQEKNNLFILKRFNDKKSVELIVNLSEENVQLDINKDILVSNNFINNTLKNEGFVLFKEETHYEK